MIRDTTDLDAETIREIEVSDDDLHRDSNGDGSLTNTDVNVFHANQDTSAVQAHPEAYDFNGAGTVDQSDVNALYEEV